MVKTSTLAVILAALIISVALTAEADGAGLVWRAVNKAGSSIHDISNVTSIGCGLNQYLSVNSSAKWACTTLTTGSNALLDGSVHTDTVAQTPTRGSVIYGDSTPKWNELVLGGASQFLFSDGIDVKYGTIKNPLLDGSNHTDTTAQTVSRGAIIYGDSTPTWNELVIGTNGQFLYSNAIDTSWKTFQVWNQTVSSGTFITGINNATGVITTATAITNVTPNDATNSTLIANNSTAGTASLKTVSTSKLIQLDNAGGTLNIKSVFNGTVLQANVTSSTPQTHAKVFDIPLSANTGNTVNGILVVSTSVANNAVVGFANLTSMTHAQGFCLWQTPTAAATINPDFILLNATGNAGGTAETTWLPAVNVAQPILFSCAVITGPTPPQLRIYIAPELTGSTAEAKAGSYAIISP